MGIGLPIKLHPEDLTMGIVTKFFYNLPDNATVVTNPLLTFAASGRQYVGSLNRWQLYAMAEAVISGLVLLSKAKFYSLLDVSSRLLIYKHQIHVFLIFFSYFYQFMIDIKVNN